MTQNFMYKRVNIFLLILMCLIVVGLAGSAIYFQESFKTLNANYDSVLTNFTTCSDVLATKEDKLLSCIEDLNSSAQNIGLYDNLYEQKVEQLQNTQAELELTDQELKQTKLDLSKAQSQYQEQLDIVTDLQAQITTLEEEVDDLEAQLNSCQDDLAAC